MHPQTQQKHAESDPQVVLRRRLDLRDEALEPSVGPLAPDAVDREGAQG
jgi:hypothetical protein